MERTKTEVIPFFKRFCYSIHALTKHHRCSDWFFFPDFVLHIENKCKHQNPQQVGSYLKARTTPLIRDSRLWSSRLRSSRLASNARSSQTAQRAICCITLVDANSTRAGLVTFLCIRRAHHVAAIFGSTGLMAHLSIATHNYTLTVSSVSHLDARLHPRRARHTAVVFADRTTLLAHVSLTSHGYFVSE